MTIRKKMNIPTYLSIASVDALIQGHKAILVSHTSSIHKPLASATVSVIVETGNISLAGTCNFVKEAIAWSRRRVLKYGYSNYVNVFLFSWRCTYKPLKNKKTYISMAGANTWSQVSEIILVSQTATVNKLLAQSTLFIVIVARNCHHAGTDNFVKEAETGSSVQKVLTNVLTFIK